MSEFCDKLTLTLAAGGELNPLGDWALLERVEADKEKDGIALPENAKAPKAKCRVLAISEWAEAEVLPGEVVLCPVDCQKGPYDIDGRECWFAETMDFLGVVEEE
ncbi:MAG: hypothetical protein II943_03650 [Victivallales bacterium]|nr:hypothetical protein [Victivallales bacterium]